MLRYPGSKKSLKTFESPVSPSTREVLDASVLGDGKKMQVGTREYEFYNIGDLARVLNRKSVTMRKWEADGVIPKAVYIKPSDDKRGVRRLYSREQIEGLINIARDEDL